MALFQRILVPTDGSETATAATRMALQLARASGGRVRFLHSIDEVAYLSGFEYSGELVHAARTYAEDVLQQALALARAAGVEADTRLVDATGQRLGDVVAHEALQWPADLVVIGTHGRRGLGRMLLGSGAEQIIRTSPLPVLVTRLPEGAAPA